MDDESNCVAKIIQSLNGETIGGQTSKAIYEITLTKESANINEFTGTTYYIFIRSTRGHGTKALWTAPQRDIHMGVQFISLPSNGGAAIHTR
jgi:hypothetical protein